MKQGPLFQEARSQTKGLLTVLAQQVGMALLAAGMAYYLAIIIDAVFLKQADLWTEGFHLVLLGGMALLRAVLTWQSERTGYALAAAVKQSIRQRLEEKIFLLGPVGVAGMGQGQLINLLSEGVEQLENYFARYLPQLISVAVIPPILLAVVVFQDTASALIMLVTAPLIPLFMILIGKAAAQLNQRQFDKMNRLSSHFLDILQGLTTLKLFGRSREQAALIGRVAADFRDTTLQVLRIAFLSALALELLATLSTAIVAVTVGMKLLFWDLEFREAFFVLLLAPEFYQPLRTLGTHFHAGMAGTAAFARIAEVLAAPVLTESFGQRILPPGQSMHVQLEQVSASYDPKAEPVLTHFSWELAPGCITALVGPSGAGKSTVAALLMGFLRPQAGRILVNGCPLGEWERESYLAQVAYIPQQPHLFAGSIWHNLTLGQEYSREQVDAAIRAAELQPLLASLPDGYETQVGEGGRGLSGGQAQRMALARAFLRQAQLVILDEATAQLDPETECQIAAAWQRILTGRTVLIIAHRLSTVRQADQIVCLQSGRLVESGSHQELLAKQGLYSQLVQAGRGGAEL